MKVLFVLRSSGFLRNFEGVIRELRRRGDEVVIAVEAPRKGDSRYARLADELRTEGVSFVNGPRRKDAAGEAAVRVRIGLDYLRYFDNRYAEGSKLRARAAAAAPAPVRWLADAPVIGAWVRRAMRRALLAFDAAAPVGAGDRRLPRRCRSPTCCS